MKLIMSKNKNLRVYGHEECSAINYIYIWFIYVNQKNQKEKNLMHNSSVSCLYYKRKSKKKI